MISLHAVVLIDITKKQAETVYRANKQTAHKNVETLTCVAALYLTNWKEYWSWDHWQ